MRPFLKWAGGKRWLFDSGQFIAPTITGRYIEPFLGGGAVFFEIRPRKAVLGDTNTRLIELYTAVRDCPDELERLLKIHALAHCKEYYYSLRGKRLRTPLTRAAQFLYLNRTCWNGLYRENRKGQFNVPVGTKQNVIFETDDFSGWSRTLMKTRLVAQDFEKTIKVAKSGDFVFVDPPYTVRHNMNGFVKYNQTMFAWQDQLRLREALGRAVERGASIAMTNADHESIRDLYSGFGNHSKLGRHSVIAGSSSHRAHSTELLVTA
ncbi:MAG: Dam family site-specific DNA-(adenine-N6)-methyltransferase [Pseudomonadota bacterium]